MQASRELAPDGAKAFNIFMRHMRGIGLSSPYSIRCNT